MGYIEPHCKRNSNSDLMVQHQKTYVGSFNFTSHINILFIFNQNTLKVLLLVNRTIMTICRTCDDLQG